MGMRNADSAILPRCGGVPGSGSVRRIGAPGQTPEADLVSALNRGGIVRMTAMKRLMLLALLSVLLTGCAIRPINPPLDKPERQRRLPLDQPDCAAGQRPRHFAGVFRRRHARGGVFMGCWKSSNARRWVRQAQSTRCSTRWTWSRACRAELTALTFGLLAAIDLRELRNRFEAQCRIRAHQTAAQPAELAKYAVNGLRSLGTGWRTTTTKSCFMAPPSAT